MGKLKTPVLKRFIVTTKMHPLFNASYLHTALIGMMVNVIKIEILPTKKGKR